MWSADSIEITADQTCWTADGYNNCSSSFSGGFGATDDEYGYGALRKRIMDEDEEMVELIKLMLTKGLM